MAFIRCDDIDYVKKKKKNLSQYMLFKPNRMTQIKSWQRHVRNTTNKKDDGSITVRIIVRQIAAVSYDNK